MSTLQLRKISFKIVSTYFENSNNTKAVNFKGTYKISL